MEDKLKERIEELVQCQFNVFVDSWCANQMSSTTRTNIIKNLQDQIIALVEQRYAGYKSPEKWFRE